MSRLTVTVTGGLLMAEAITRAGRQLGTEKGVCEGPGSHRDRPVVFAGSVRALPHRRFRGSPRERFEAKVDRSAGPLACWPWLAKLDRDGYGTLWVSRRQTNYRAARFAYELVHGALPADQVARHKCDNPVCVNPAHVEPGTQLDNIEDMRVRRRSTIGEKNPRAKLTEAAVIALRAEYAAGARGYARLSRRYGVSEAAVRSVVLGLTWRSVGASAGVSS